MKFKHENVHLVPYPYICTLYLELNSFQQNVSCGKEVNRGSDELVKRRKEVSESTEVEEAVKRRRVEVGVEDSSPQLHMDRTRADSVHRMSKAEPRFEKNFSKADECKFSPASLTKDWKCVESGLEQGTAASQAEGTVQLPQQMGQTGKKGNGK
ncbi:MAJIN protein, partial [Mionectes macconnelli]|nr:MAJIN protein [Mionectes macconnelli]